MAITSIEEFIRATEIKAKSSRAKTAFVSSEILEAISNNPETEISRLRRRISELEEENKRLKAQQARQPLVAQPVSVPVKTSAPTPAPTPVVPKEENKDDTEVRFSLLELT